ncbi:MAG: CarD-like/TRCF domain protein [Lachnospiraceae bacterium]|nr:CarD-like/TRCF domain protein [Lachnospiraceae bacterium]
MFEKKQIIFSSTMGVVKVSDIVNLSADKKNPLSELIPYYFLKEVADPTKVAYIPVAHHQVELRELITVEEAKAVSEEEKKDMDPLLAAEVDYVLAHAGDKKKRS